MNYFVAIINSVIVIHTILGSISKKKLETHFQVNFMKNSRRQILKIDTGIYSMKTESNLNKIFNYFLGAIRT